MRRGFSCWKVRRAPHTGRNPFVAPTVQALNLSYDPRKLVAEYPALEAPARELGLLDEDGPAASVTLDDLPKRLVDYFPDVRLIPLVKGEAIAPKVISFEDLLQPRHQGGSGTRLSQGHAQVHLECVEGHVSVVDLLREFGCVVEMVTGRLLSMMRGQSDLVMRGRHRILEFNRQVTPGHYLETAGFKFPDHSREYVNRHAAALQSLALALLTRTDPRYVFIDVLEAARDDAQMLKLLSALAFRSNIDFRDRKELEDYANLYWRLVPGPNEYYCNVHQVNDAASYYARQLRAHVRALAV